MKALRRPYLYEIVVVVNLALIAAYAPQPVLSTLPGELLSVSLPSLACIALCAGIRVAFAARQGHARRLLRIYFSRRWLIESVRLVVALTLLTHAYGWIKLLVPVMHPRLYDQQLFEIDKALCGGISPTIFLVTLFSNPHFLRFIDLAYANMFFATLLIATGYFLSSPSARLRVAYMTSNAALWLTGAWLYAVVPSLGPAYRFPGIWLEYGASLPRTQAIQAALMQNYRTVLRLAQGIPGPVQVVYGIAAFPSLHVAYQTFVALWMRREWVYGEIVFGVCAFFILIGSMITGWHYLVDGIAGVVLAVICYALPARSLPRRSRRR